MGIGEKTTVWGYDESAKVGLQQAEGEPTGGVLRGVRDCITGILFKCFEVYIPVVFCVAIKLDSNVRYRIH